MKISQYVLKIQDLVQEAENARNALIECPNFSHESIKAIRFLTGKVYAYRKVLDILEDLIDRERRN